MEKYFIGKRNELVIVDLEAKLIRKSEEQKQFIDLIRTISVNMGDFSMEKFGPLVSISANNREDTERFWITIDFESGEIFFTKVSDFSKECARLKISPFDD